MTARQLLTAAVLLGLTPAAPAQTVSDLVASRGKAASPFLKVVAPTNDSTVRVRCDDRDAALGTIVFADGYILTKASEMRGRVTVRLPDGSEENADMVAVHTFTDLALLKVDAKGLKPVAFSASRTTPPGNWVVATGFGTGPTAVGIVSVSTRTLTGADTRPPLKLNPDRGFLGVILSEVEVKDGGAKVDSVSAKSAAEKAGLKKDDVIFEVDGQSIASEWALRELLNTHKPGDVLAVRLKRDGKPVDAKVTLTGDPSAAAARPAPKGGRPDRAEFQNTLGGNKLSERRTGFPSVLTSDMVLKPTECGGPVVDLDGKVLGITIARAGRVDTYVLPSETITALLPDMKAGKHPPVSVKKEKDKDTK